MKWLSSLWKDYLYMIEELHKAGVCLPNFGYPFEIFVDPKWFDLEDDTLKQK